jgi:hypothetical protein
VELGARKEGLFELQGSVTGFFHDQSDSVCVMEKHSPEGINPIAVCGCYPVAKIGRHIREVFTLNGCPIDRGVGDPVGDSPVD